MLVCGRSSDNLWALPKGTPEDGETLEQTACVRCGKKPASSVETTALVGDIKYWFSRPQEGVRYRKTVRHYCSGLSAATRPCTTTSSMRCAGYPCKTARKLLTYQNEARILRQAIDLAEGKQEIRQA